MHKSTRKPRRKRVPKRVRALPNLEQSKAAVLNTLTSASGQRTYDHAIGSSSPGTAQSRASRSTGRSCSATASISNSETTLQRRSISASRPCGAWPARRPMPGCSALNWRPAFGESKACVGLACV